ncbi:MULTISPECIES: DUF488 domain-containing protein [Streptomyces]|uniref:Uncharacterized protein n=3 Tax=Streptomyces TaxID=1883 RepID=A0A1D8G9S6_9ACTN|nr:MULTISPECIES: DUF488 family protein [Streptomyces]AOT62217.1 hypothetical protein A4G23_05111 [Streptomyces rubrolavendulae]KAF0646677.1 hypothetical protein K701_27230 [Streptomyces fradiae ATCC 10745 = DSM 40063]OSY52772.1 hypothetical protein BG846_01570 [Streptomyces fradiae ATCC 10745 = DSM 40063]BAD95836.1 hypothetical protein [Streptomyces fradiae]
MNPSAHRVRLRRVYDPPEPADGTRVLVDRLWPRGLAKADAHIDEWPKSATPSTELRRWFHAADGAPDEVFEEFRRRYAAELAEPEAAGALDRVRDLAREGPLTLLTAARDPERSHAAVLRERLSGG